MTFTIPCKHLGLMKGNLSALGVAQKIQVMGFLQIDDLFIAGS